MPDLSAARQAPQASAGDWLRTLPPAARFILQGGRAARIVASEAFGVTLSEQACRASSLGDRAALWLGPDEHLLLGPAADVRTITERLETALAGAAHSLVDISHRQIGLVARGLHASDILSTGCPLDLDITEFPPGMCTRTLLGKADIVLWRTDGGEFRLEVWRSFAGYVAASLREAARDFVPST
jgi:sarcosine oxidase subunit gamma